MSSIGAENGKNKNKIEKRPSFNGSIADIRMKKIYTRMIDLIEQCE